VRSVFRSTGLGLEALALLPFGFEVRDAVCWSEPATECEVASVVSRLARVVGGEVCSSMVEAKGLCSDGTPCAGARAGEDGWLSWIGCRAIFPFDAGGGVGFRSLIFRSPKSKARTC
jgi:hypothetical protein